MSAKKQLPSVGANVTGIGAAPERADRMTSGMGEFPPTSHGNGHEAAQRRVEYAKEGFGVGSIPKTGLGGREADSALAPLIDKLGARLAFERAGTRLYDALLSKHEAYGTFDGGPDHGDLADIRQEEHEHVRLVERAIARLGGDPTALTPSADLELNVGKGLPAVIADPRTTLLESLEAVLVAELVDNESWEGLLELAQRHGQGALAEECERALETEQEHLSRVRTWVAAGQGRPS